MLHVAHSVWVGVQVWHLEFDVSAAATAIGLGVVTITVTITITIIVLLGMGVIVGFRNVFPLSETNEYR